MAFLFHFFWLARLPKLVQPHREYPPSQDSQVARADG
jgi:hypothetical protein